ncbi:MAG: efflux RND transporter permease subunit [Flavobacteriales bacterium]|nr:efflux RND transporter permease subunit [Flavobacteriales bacterium]
MKGFTGYFLRYRVSAFAVMALLPIFGWFAAAHFKAPSSRGGEPAIQVQVAHPGASPGKRWSRGGGVAIEDDLKGVSGVERISSVSQENGRRDHGGSAQGASMPTVLQDVKNAIERIPALPEGMEPVRAFKVESCGSQRQELCAHRESGIGLKALKNAATRAELDLRAIPGISKVVVAARLKRKWR